MSSANLRMKLSVSTPILSKAKKAPRFPLRPLGVIAAAKHTPFQYDKRSLRRLHRISRSEVPLNLDDVIAQNSSICLKVLQIKSNREKKAKGPSIFETNKYCIKSSFLSRPRSINQHSKKKRQPYRGFMIKGTSVGQLCPKAQGDIYSYSGRVI